MESDSRDDAFKKGAIFAVASPSEDREVFTPANIHRHRMPHPGYHAAHTAVVAWQHQGTSSAQEHRATTTRAAAPESKTLTPSPPSPTAETGGKDLPFTPLAGPNAETQ